MAEKLQIRKKDGNVWLHVRVDVGGQEFILSKFYARWGGDKMEITEPAGSDNAREYLYTDITVYDDTAAGTPETFASSLELAQRLKTLGYTAFSDGGDVVIADLISTDLPNDAFLGTDGKIRSIQERNNTNKLGYHVLPSDFDFTSIPVGYDNSTWEIRYTHDLGGSNITIPNNVTLLFNGGKLTNYGVITLDETYIDFVAITEIFDGSGSFIGRPKTVKGFITPQHFGAIEDDTFDCTSAFNKMSDFVGANKISGFIDQGRPSYTFPLDVSGVEIHVPSGMYKITNTIRLKAGQKWKGSRAGTILHFTPTVLGTDLLSLDNSVSDDNYFGSQQRYIEIDGFTLSGDVNYSGIGNARNGIYTLDASFCNVKNVIINKFEYGVSVNIGSPPVAAYYNSFEKVDIQQCRQNVFVGEGTAVTSFRDCVLVGRGEFTAKYDYNVEVNNNTTFENCSFEGSSWNKYHIKAPIGKVTVLGGRVEGVGLFEANGRGVTGAVSVNIPNGVTEGFGEITNIDDAPLEVDMNDDQNVLGQNFSFGQGIAQELQMLKNQSWKLGVQDWLFDGTSGYYELINEREELLGSENGIRLVKTSTSTTYSITQPMNINTPQFYASVWVRSSSDAILRTQIGVLYARDNDTTIYFKEFSPMLKVGDWELYVAKISHYYKDTPSLNPRPYLGLTTSSPIGSWVVFSNLRFWSGGYPIFNGSNDNQVNKNYISSELPTQALLELGDIVNYDGTNPSYPITESSSRGVVCSFNLDSNLDSNALSGDNTIDIPDASDVSDGDYIGIYQNTGGISWTTVDSVSVNTITLTDVLGGDSDNGNKVYIYRLVPIENDGGGGGGSILTAVKTSDETISNSNTVVLDSELQISLEANSYYDIEVQTLYEADAAADFRTQFEIPTLSTGSFWRVNHSSTTGQVPDTTIISNSGNGIGSLRHTRFFVSIYTDVNSGVFGLKWAQNSSNPIGTILRKGSGIKAVKLN